MPKQTTTVTHQDGTRSTRTSASRTYTHAIEVSPAPAEAYAAYLRDAAETHERSAAELEQAAESGRVLLSSRGFATDPGSDHHSHCARLEGTDLFTWASAEGMTRSYQGAEPEMVRAATHLREIAREEAASLRERAVSLRAEAEQVRAAGAPIGTYTVVRWSSRYDLAASALGEFSHYATEGRTVRVVPVDAPAT